MPSFDYEGAKSAGLSDKDIIDGLSKELDFDLSGAREAGLDDPAILKGLLDRANTPSQPEVEAISPAEAPVEEAAAPVSQPIATAVSILPGFTVPFSVLETAGQLAEGFKEHRIDPLLGMLGAVADPKQPGSLTELNDGAAFYMVNNGLEEALAAESSKPNPNFQQALKDNTTSNAMDMALTSLDVATIGVASAATTALRAGAAKLGLGNVLGTIVAGAIEGSGYFATYEGVQAAIEGETAGEIAKEAAKGAAIGAPVGAGLSALGLGIVRMSRAGKTTTKPLVNDIAEAATEKVVTERAVAETASQKQLLDDAQAFLREEHPHLNNDQVEEFARRIALDGEPIEALPIPSAPTGKAPNDISHTTAWEAANTGNIPQRSFAVSEGEKFHRSLSTVPGAEVREKALYLDPRTKLFMADDGTAGLAVTAEGELISPFRMGNSTADVNPLVAEASKISKTLRTSEAGADLFGQHGWRPVARVPGEVEDIILMVRDPHGRSGLPAVPPREAGGFGSLRDDVLVVENLDAALTMQESAAVVGRLPSDEAASIAFDEALSTTNQSDFPEVRLEQRARTVPFYGPPELRPIARATGRLEGKTVRDHAKSIKEFMAGIFVADPGVSINGKKILRMLRLEHATAGERADLLLSVRVFNRLKGNRQEIGEKTATLSDYLTSLDELATMKSFGTTTGTGGTTADQWVNLATQTAQKMKDVPDVVRTARITRSLLDDMQGVMVEYNMIPKGQFREDYIPRQRMYEVAQIMTDHMQGTPVGKELSAALRRGKNGEIRQTNIVKLMRTSLKALYQKIAEIEGWKALKTDDAINVTRMFEADPTMPIPRGWTAYRPPAWVERATNLEPGTLGEVASGAIAGLPVKGNRWLPGTYVIPTPVMKSLRNFYRRETDPVARTIYGITRAIARHLTIWSPTNTPLNYFSDWFLSMLGLPGERNDLVGLMRFSGAAHRGAFGGVFKNNQPLYERAIREGIAGSSFIKSVGGETVPRVLEAAQAQGASPSLLDRFRDFMSFWIRVRQGVESSPRIAAGLAAERRIGAAPLEPLAEDVGVAARQLARVPETEFGRVGRDISLPFGSGDPEITRSPIVGGLLANFWRFTGLATARTVQLAGTKGSRMRGLLALVAPMVSTTLWNNQNEDFRQIERSLSEHDRMNPHLILSNPTNPRIPLRKKNGRPVVWPFRWFVPQEIAAFYGMGNLGTRGLEVLSGRVSPTEFIGEIAGETTQNLSQLPASGGVIEQALTGESSLTGQELTPTERISTALPIFYHIAKAHEIAENEGIIPALIQTPARLLSGIREAGARKGFADARVLEARRKVREFQMRRNWAARNGNEVQRKRFEGEMEKWQDRLRRRVEGAARLEEVLQGAEQ